MTNYDKIMLVDDDIDDRMTFEQLLKEVEPSIQLVTAENGLDMVALLDRCSDRDLPSLIILDQNMPKMSGKESLLFLKDSVRYRSIPVIIYSTFQVGDFFRECQGLGAVDVVSKPDTMQAYRDMIMSFIVTAG